MLIVERFLLRYPEDLQLIFPLFSLAVSGDLFGSFATSKLKPKLCSSSTNETHNPVRVTCGFV